MTGPDGSAESRDKPRKACLLTLAVLTLATAIGSAGLAAGTGAPIAGLIVALGGFAALSLAGTVVAARAILTLAFAHRAI